MAYKLRSGGPGGNVRGIFFLIAVGILPNISFAAITCAGSIPIDVSGRVEVLGGEHASTGRLELMCQSQEDQSIHSLRMVSSTDNRRPSTRNISMERFLQSSESNPVPLVSARILGLNFVSIRPVGTFDAHSGGEVVIEFLGDSPDAPDLYLVVSRNNSGWRVVQKESGRRLLAVRDVIGDREAIDTYNIRVLQ